MRKPYAHGDPSVPTPRRALTVAVVTVLAAALGACSPPGPAAQPDTADPDPSPVVSTDIGTAPVTLHITEGSCERLAPALTDAFMEEYPNVTIELTLEDCTQLPASAPRIMAGDNPPDIIRMSSFGSAVEDGLLTNLDPYAAAYGWDELPPSQLEQLRVASNGRTRGTGSLYGMPYGFGLVGVYFDKAKASQIGMQDPPATVEEFDALLAAAKAAGEVPLMASNQDGLVSYFFQGLLNQYVDQAELTAWLYTAPGATFDTPGAVQAAEQLQRWAEAGYFPDDVNSLNQDQALGRFIDGEGVFYSSGNWRAATLDEQMAGDVGFFLMPPAAAGGPYVTMSAPAGMAIPVKSRQHAAAAFYLDWLQSDTARALQVQVTGLAPSGRADQPIPPVAEGSVTAEILHAWQQLGQSDGLVGFLADATAGINTSALIPELQLLVAGRTSPDDLVDAIQAEYEQELGT